MRRNLTQEFLIEEYKKLWEHMETLYKERDRVTRFFAAIASSPIIVVLVTSINRDQGYGLPQNNLVFFLVLGITLVVSFIGFGLFIHYVWNRFNYQEKYRHAEQIAIYFKRKGNVPELMTEMQRSPAVFYLTFRADFWFTVIFVFPNSFYFTIVGSLFSLKLFSFFSGLSVDRIVDIHPSYLFSLVVLLFLGFIALHVLVYVFLLKGLELEWLKRYSRAA